MGAVASPFFVDDGDNELDTGPLSDRSARRP